LFDKGNQSTRLEGLDQTVHHPLLMGWALQARHLPWPHSSQGLVKGAERVRRGMHPPLQLPTHEAWGHSARGLLGCHVPAAADVYGGSAVSKRPRFTESKGFVAHVPSSSPRIPRTRGLDAEGQPGAGPRWSALNARRRGGVGGGVSSRL